MRKRPASSSPGRNLPPSPDVVSGEVGARIGTGRCRRAASVGRIEGSPEGKPQFEQNRLSAALATPQEGQVATSEKYHTLPAAGPAHAADSSLLIRSVQECDVGRIRH